MAALGLGAALLLAPLLPGATPAGAANLSTFDPGYLVSDAVFFDAGTMSADEVQAFISSKETSCRPAADGTPCLKDYRQTTVTRAPDAKCPGGYLGAENESAAAIIYKVATGCGINPRVILVTLQKEQGLVTASGTSLTPTRYRSAMGYGCPDTAACDSLYYGFFNQVYSAAAQFRNYALNPTRYSHRAGFTNNLLFHPNSACGSSAVYIKNQATAGLYNYTPYQPNAAALAAGYGTGDSCSSYGNRNFVNYFSDWFGSPTGSAPIGFLDTATVTQDGFTVSGWTLDPDTNASIAASFTVDGLAAGTPVLANISRPDVGAATGRGDLHGYSAFVPSTAGRHTVCATGLNNALGGNTQLGCAERVIPSSPRGFVDTVTSDATSITATGWANDPDTDASIKVHVYLDGVGTAFTADAPRPDLAAALGIGVQHGFTATVPAAVGPHTVCIWAIDATGDRNVQMLCRSITVVNHDPRGMLDSVTVTGRTVTATGWAYDPDTAAPTAVHMYVGAASQAFTAGTSRPDVAAFFGIGQNHGFSATMPVAPGTSSVCLWAINASPGNNAALGCRTVTVANASPIGFLDSVTTGPGLVTANGWAIDPDTDDPIDVRVSVDGASITGRADLSRPDLATAFGKGDRHGFTSTRVVSAGNHTVCVEAINATPGTNAPLGCRTVSVPANAIPTGFVDSFDGKGGKVTVTGWALDRDTTDPITVHLYVDGASAAFTANQPRPDIGLAFGKGDLHGFSASLPAAPGPHSVCVWALNSTPGANALLTCSTVTVTS